MCGQNIWGLIITIATDFICSNYCELTDLGIYFNFHKDFNHFLRHHVGLSFRLVRQLALGIDLVSMNALRANFITIQSTISGPILVSLYL